MTLLVYFAFFVTFMEKTHPIIKFFGVFNQFSRTCEVAKFCITPRVTQYTRMSKKKYVNYALHVSFWNCLYMSFCFMMKKDHSKQKLLLWPQVPFKNQFRL